MEEKKDILWRVYLVYFVVCLFGLAIVSKAAFIQFVQGDEWKQKAANSTIKYHNIEAIRGDIYSTNGSLMATSVPIYEVRIDLKADGLTKKIFNENIGALSAALSNLFKDKTASEYKKQFIKARNKGARYYLVHRKVKYTDLKKMRDFPIFKLGRYKGGVIYLQKNKRQKPFRVLAARTIGYSRKGIKPVGLEGAYGSELRGESGVRLMQKIAGGIWKPVNDDNEIEPQDGCDIYTTIDINIQDVAYKALEYQLKKQDADHGCVVLMEVATGDIKAISNLSKDEDGDYYEYYNYAIGESTEPGSTFKLASIMAAIEDGLIDVTDSVDTENGTTRFYDQVMRDSHYGGYGKISLQRAFEVSSNVGISKLINQSYFKNPQAFIDRLYKMNLNQPLGIKIAGEGIPNIKTTADKSWSGVTLPWMSIGYEVSLTPLQILTFYNAVANNGVMVRPKFVSEIKKRGRTIKYVDTEIINPSICSQSTLKKVKEMLEGVVERGTGRNLKNSLYKIAGKTGTAQIANDKYGYKYDSKTSYQASFVGYFPADKPKYSCIVVVNAPSKNVYYGNLVAGPIFKEIANKVYANSLEIHQELQQRNFTARTPLPISKNGYQSDLEEIFNELSINTHIDNPDNEWALTRTNTDSVEILNRRIRKNLVPNVVGMGLEDAIYLLENNGLSVQFSGKGAIKEQSLQAGTKIKIGEKISLELS